MKKARCGWTSLQLVELFGRRRIMLTTRKMIAFLTLVLTFSSTFSVAADTDVEPWWPVPDASTPFPTVGQVFTTDGITNYKLTSPVMSANNNGINWTAPCFATPKIIAFPGIVFIYTSVYPTAGPAHDGCEWNRYGWIYAEQHYTYIAYTTVTTDPVTWPYTASPTNTPNLDPGKPDCPQIPLN